MGVKVEEHYVLLVEILFGLGGTIEYFECFQFQKGSILKPTSFINRDPPIEKLSGVSQVV